MEYEFAYLKKILLNRFNAWIRYIDSAEQEITTIESLKEHHAAAVEDIDTGVDLHLFDEDEISEMRDRLTTAYQTAYLRLEGEV